MVEVNKTPMFERLTQSRAAQLVYAVGMVAMMSSCSYEESALVASSEHIAELMSEESQAVEVITTATFETPILTDVAASTAAVDAVIEVAPPGSESENDISQAMFEGETMGLSSEEMHTLGALSLLMEALDIESQQQLDNLIGQEGWQFQTGPENSNFRGLTFPGQRLIEIYPREGDSEVMTARIIAHELGHALDVAREHNSSRADYAEAAEQELVPQWWPDAFTSDFETGAGDYAEGFAVWAMERAGFEIHDRSQVSPDGNTDAVNEYFENMLESSR